MKIGVISAGLGTAVSISNLINKIGQQAEMITDFNEIKKFSHIVLPGVGSFDEGSRLIVETEWGEAIRGHVSKGKMLLGVCLGMQLLGKRSDEGTLSGLGILDFENSKLVPSVGFKVPNIGWEKVDFLSDHPIANDLQSTNRFYFVHSFGVRSKSEFQLATTAHTETFCSVIGFENVVGVQFHPEKSHRYGKILMANFLGMDT